MGGDRTQILDVQQQADGKYLVVTHDGTQVRAYAMDDVRPSVLKSDKVSTIGKRQAIGIGTEVPAEATYWMGEHGINSSLGASFTNGGAGAALGSQAGPLPRVSRAEQIAAAEEQRKAQEALQAAQQPVPESESVPELGQEPEWEYGDDGPVVERLGLYPGEAQRLRALGFDDNEILAMTPAKRKEVLARDGDWFNGIVQPSAADIEAERAATGAGPVTGGYRVAAGAPGPTDRIGWTMRLRNDQGVSEVGLVVDEAEAGSGSMYRVRTRNGREYWVSSANAQFVTPATEASRAAAAAPAPVPVGPVEESQSVLTPGKQFWAGPKKVSGQQTPLQLGIFPILSDTLAPSYTDEAGNLIARNQFQQAGAETYRLGQAWQGPLAGEKGAPPQFRAGDIVLINGEDGPTRAQILGLGEYDDPVFGKRQGYRVNDGRVGQPGGFVVPADEIRGLAWQNLAGKAVSPAPLQMSLLEQAKARRIYESGYGAEWGGAPDEEDLPVAGPVVAQQYTGDGCVVPPGRAALRRAAVGCRPGHRALADGGTAPTVRDADRDGRRPGTRVQRVDGSGQLPAHRTQPGRVAAGFRNGAGRSPAPWRQPRHAGEHSLRAGLSQAVGIGSMALGLPARRAADAPGFALLV